MGSSSSSSGSGFTNSPNSRSVNELLQQSENSFNTAEYQSEVNNFLQQLLKEFNNRPVEAIKKHIDTLKQAIESEIENSVTLIFGGSVSKHTFINGLSDIDALVCLNKTNLEKSSPKEVLNYFSERIKQRLPTTEVETGALAVTVRYSDGCEIQLLPAIRTASGFRIAKTHSSEEKWSNVVRPKAFAEKLTTVNQACNRNMVPVIKLFKAVSQNFFPQTLKLSGYHVESLAIEAFKNYSGRKTYKDMLTHLCKKARDNVLAPIKDKTGQSLHVDDYLGQEGSKTRKQVSSHLDRLVNRIEKSDKLHSIEDWEQLFE